MREEWRPIAGYEGVYSVSDRGRVRRDLSRTCGKAGHILKPSPRGRYGAVSLSKDGKKRQVLVHQAVAAAFLGPRPLGMTTNHRDGKRRNCRASNLEYGTQSHNVKEAYRLGLRDCRGASNGRAKLTARKVRAIRRRSTGKRGEQAAMAREFKLDRTTVGQIIRRERWKHV